jgi:glycosyltransferase involved in cell wall biosynthesis
MKTISIIVAAYNMEEYLGRCLDSVVDHKWDDSVEVIVVNDGSKDNTLQIARQYQADYPQIVTVIDKENGHHGSCTNAALPIAKGKYVKVLDADDWFDPQAFDVLIHKLQTLDTDLVVTNYTKHYDSETIQIRYCSHDYTADCELLTSSHSHLPYLGMHAVTYRTELLQKMEYRQSEGVYHSDVEWVFCPLFFVETLAFVNANVYQHFLARAGQSSEPAVFKKNLSHRQVVAIRMLEYYFTFNRDSLSKQMDAYLFRIMNRFVISIYKTCFLWQSDSHFIPDPDMMISFDQTIRKKNEPFYNNLSKEVLYKWLPIPYIRYLRTCSMRLPSWIRYSLKIARKAVHLIRSLRTYIHI